MALSFFLSQSASMASKRRRWILGLILIAVFPLVPSIRNTKFMSPQHDEQVHKYNVGDYIPLIATQVFSTNNSCEAYSYFELPFCPPGDPIARKKKTLEEVLAGDCFTNTQYELNFMINKEGELLCEKNLTKDEVAKFRYAVKNEFKYHMYYDSILLQGAVGKVVKYVDDPSLTPRYYLYNHIRFLVYYLENRVKDIVLMREYGSWADITEDAEIIGLNFSYTLLWYKIQPGRINAPLLDQISCPDIDWYWPQAQEPKGWEVVLSFMYSASSIFIWVAFLLAVTMPYLTNYFTRYSQKALVDDRGMSRVNGIHRGTACKCPAYSSLLGAVLGIGSQIFIMIFTFFGLAFIFKLNPCNPKVVHFVLFMTYGLTSPVAGYIATSFHYKFTRVGWKECIFQTGVLFLVPVMLTTVVVNGLAVITYGTSEVPEFLDIAVSVFFTFAFLLHCLGGVIAYHFRPKHAPSCTTKRFPTEISLQPWFLRTSGQMLLGGLLPFTVIFWQMDNVYASLWNRKVCGAFQAMVTCSFVVVTMTIMVGIVFTGYQLSRKDHHWWWRSVLRGGSTAIFMFVYGIYFHSRTRTEDFMKFLLFMGYNACIFYAFFLALGAIGYWASSFVFRRMYHNLQKYE